MPTPRRTALLVERLEGLHARALAGWPATAEELAAAVAEASVIDRGLGDLAAFARTLDVTPWIERRARESAADARRLAALTGPAAAGPQEAA